MLVSALLCVLSMAASPTAAQRLDRLVALANLDAAVRYFDPPVAMNAARWDSLFAASVVDIADAPDAREYGRRVDALMRALGDPPLQAAVAQRTLLYDGFPSPVFRGSGGYALRWTSAKGPVVQRIAMGEGASAEVRLSADMAGDSTVTVSPLSTSPQMLAAYPSTGYRILGAMRVWSTTKLFNPYRSLMGENWDEQLGIALRAAEDARTGTEYARSIAAFTARIHDTHVNVSGGDMRFVLPNRLIGANARLIENQLVITRIVDSAADRAGLRAGDVVLSVDGERVDERINRLTPWISASTPQALRYRLEGMLLNGSDTAAARLVVRGAAGGDRTVLVPRATAAPLKELSRGRDGSVVRTLPDNIGYIDLAALTVPMVDSAFRMLAGTKAIILDDRGYPQGTAWSIAPRLNTHGDHVTAALFTRLQVPSPDTSSTVLYSFNQPIPDQGALPRYAGRTVMLIDERAISQSEHTGLFLEAANGTKFIGSPTVGSNGDVTSFAIPGGMMISFTGQSVRHADGRPLQRVGLQPDLLVLPTLAGIRSGHDEVLEAAHRFLGGGGTVPADTARQRPAEVETRGATLPPEPMPSGWMRLGAATYRVGLDRSVGRSGGASGHIMSTGASGGFGSLSQIIRADAYRGKRVRFSAYARTRDVGAPGATLWMRVDGSGGMLAFDNMSNRPLLGTSDWRLASIVLDVPQEAEGIMFGMLLMAGGEAWIDDASLEVVGLDVPTTNLMPAAVDASKVEEQRALYGRFPNVPANMKFDP